MYVEWSNPLAIVITIVSVILIVLCLLTSIDFIIWIDTKVIRASSPLFCMLILLGGIMGFASALLFLGQPTNGVCLARIWLSGLAFATVYSNLIAKNYRLYRIFKNLEMRVFAISNRDLILQGVLPIVLIELIILILWTSLDPLVVVHDDKSVLLAEDEVNIRCVSQESWGVGLFLAFKMFLLALGTVVSYNTRDLVEYFKESQGIGLGVCFIFLIL